MNIQFIGGGTPHPVAQPQASANAVAIASANNTTNPLASLLGGQQGAQHLGQTVPFSSGHFPHAGITPSQQRPSSVLPGLGHPQDPGLTTPGLGSAITPNLRIGSPNGLTLIEGSPSFSQLSHLMNTTDLKNPLIFQERNEGPLTVLAPTNEAFQKLGPAMLERLSDPRNAAALRQILAYHVSRGQFQPAATPQRIDSLNNQDGTVVLSDNNRTLIGNVGVGGNQLVTGGVPLQTQGGSVIIPIDQVLLPPNLEFAV
jgi:uncharacterized surface protein with fasciclin (FAS1) repeats